MHDDHELLLRPLDESDVSQWAALLMDIEATDRTGEHYSADDLLEELRDPAIDPEKDTVGVWVGQTLAAYAAMVPRDDGAADEPLVIYLDAGVHPDHRGRGLGGRLGDLAVARATDQAVERSRTSVDVRANVLVSDAAGERLLTRRGFEPFRFSFDMKRELADLSDDAGGHRGVPEGWSVRPYAPADDDDLLAAHNIAFADYPGFSAWSRQEWSQRVTETRNFAPEHSWVVRDDRGEVAAYLIAMEYDAHTEVTGTREVYVAKLGTLPAHRGRGLGTMLLHRCMERAAAAGFHSAGLDVDTLNPSGALAIYERAGFRATVSWRSMRLLLPVESASAVSLPT